MDIRLNLTIAVAYKSPAQIARVVTEDWLSRNMFCPHCGKLHIRQMPNNSPVSDFICPDCKREYELKSKKGGFNNIVNDGAYDTMIERITSNNNPDFFLLDYSLKTETVNNLIFIPKYFFVPEIIIKRKPLASTARRAGWVGCNINLLGIPSQGIVPIITNGQIQDVNTVLSKTRQSKSLETKDIKQRGWLMDVLMCVNKQPQNFTLNDMYLYTQMLEVKHPDNHNIQPKIRQQLQLLRDKGYIEFLGHGKYRRIV